MTDELLEKIYGEALQNSHLAGLKAVFEAGAKSISEPYVPLPTPERAASNRAAVADAKAKLADAERNG